MTGIRPELIEKASRLTDWSQHEYRVDSGTWIPSCVCGWKAEEPYDVPAYDRHMTEIVLATVADDLRAEAWDEGAEAAWERSTPEVNGQTHHWRREGEPLNPYRIEARDECPDCGGDPSLPVPVDSGFCHAHHVGTDRIEAFDAALREQLAAQVEALAPDLTVWRSDYRDGRAHMATEAAHTMRGGEQS